MSDRVTHLRVVVPDPAAERAWGHLRQMADGDHEGLAGLYDLLGARIYSLALRMLRDTSDAEEVVQDVFAQAWRTAASYDRGRGTVPAWLLVMTRSRALDRLRSRRALGRAIPSADTDPDVLPDAGLRQDLVAINDEQAAELRRALDELPADQKSAIELAFFEGLTHPEVATRLAQPLGTIKTRIRLGLTKLREVFVRSSGQDSPA